MSDKKNNMPKPPKDNQGLSTTTKSVNQEKLPKPPGGNDGLPTKKGHTNQKSITGNVIRNSDKKKINKDK